MTTTKTTATNAQDTEMITTSMRKAANGCALVMGAVSMKVGMRMNDDTISRKAAIDAHYEYCNKHPDAGFPVWSLKILENLPSAQPVAKDINVPVKDCISRQAAIDALFELYEYQRDIDPTEAADLVRQGIFLAEKKIEKLPSAQPETHEERTETHSCDCISRQAAIDALTRKMVSIPTAGEKDLMGDVNRIRAEDISVIKRLPSAQPEVLACGEGELIAQPEIVRCKDCKHWKDSDGVYRRGIGAESKCPVNIRAVYEGNFYCGYAERRTDGN